MYVYMSKQAKGGQTGHALNGEVNGSATGSPSNPSKTWISKEYKSKLSSSSTAAPLANKDEPDGSPPKKKQKLLPKTHESPKKPEEAESVQTVKIPKDVSSDINTLKNRLHETLKMYEELQSAKNGENEQARKERESVKEMLNKTIENIETQMRKLMVHQKKRM